MKFFDLRTLLALLPGRSTGIVIASKLIISVVIRVCSCLQSSNNTLNNSISIVTTQYFLPKVHCKKECAHVLIRVKLKVWIQVRNFRKTVRQLTVPDYSP